MSTSSQFQHHKQVVNSHQGVFSAYRTSDVSRSTGQPRETLYSSSCAHLIAQQQAVWPRCVFMLSDKQKNKTRRATDNRCCCYTCRLEYIHGEDKRMITYHRSQLLLLTVIFSATRTPANVQGARDLSKKGKVLNCGPHTKMDKLCNFTLYFCL